jgi:GntR family transcriptional regulator
MPQSDSRLPRYVQIRDELMRRICARAWVAGDALPAEDRLAAEFGVSLGTLRKALEVLVADGMVERIHGRGTYVTRAFERISMLRFIGYSLAEDRAMPETATVKLEVRQNPPIARDRLGLPPAEKLLYLHRTRSHGGEVLLSEHVWLQHKRFARLEALLQRESPPLLYPVYDALCGALVSRAADRLSVHPLPDADAALFSLPRKTLGVRIDRSMLDHAGQPIEWRVSYVTTQRFDYAVEMR